MNSYQILLSRIRQVRRRWRAQLLVKGLSLFLASAIALLVLGVWGADLFGFTAGSVLAMRILTGAACLAVALRFIVLPLLRRISDVQIARYVEERYPQLQDRLVTAVEFGGGGVSTGMLDLVIRDALDKASRVDFSVFLDRRRVASFGALGGAAFLVLLALLTWGPSFFPYGFDLLYLPWTDRAVAAPLLVQVTPGSTEIHKGTDQLVTAQLVGFDSPDVRLYVQPETSTVWTPLPMEPESRGAGFQYLLIDVQSSMRYYVESKGVRSNSYTLTVVDVPRVDGIDLTYHFPAYTGMEPQTVEDEGDISGLKGTRVDLKVRVSQPVRSARLLLNDESEIELSGQGPSAFAGSLTIRESGSYVVQLTPLAGGRAQVSPEYTIEAIEDAPPKVTITKPFRDVRATNVEEVFSEVRAEDDLGVARVELRFSVNGGEERPISLFAGRAARDAVTAAHTFFLEEFNLQPGDLISYYGRATDNNNVTGPGTSSSDIYFIHIRPFEHKYTQSQQGGAPMGSGDGAQEALSRQQKEIISATFKLIRDKGEMDPKEYRDGLDALALVQSRLQAQAQGLVERLQRRGAAEADDSFGKLAEYLRAAVAEMEKAALNLGAHRPSEALPEEQRALQQLMRAESLFREIQVSFGSQGGSGGGSSANAEDLADLFELELNKLKNQYETVQRGEQQARDQQVDEAMQRLKELAQRQQQLNERNRMMAQRGSSSSSSGSSGGQSQQQLMEEAERLQRQLQRLSRERSSPELNRVSSQLDRAIQQMRNALERDQRGDSREAEAQGIRALQQLEEARRALARGMDAGLAQGMEQAVEESRGLVAEQNRIQEGVQRLTQQKDRTGSPEFQQRRSELMDRKDVLADRVRNLSDRIEDLARQSRRSEKEASSRLNEASGMIREKKLPERILSGNQLLENGYYDFIEAREEYIRGGLEDLQRQLETARNSLGQTPENRLEDAVERTRQLAEGLESVQRRLQNLQRGQGEAQRGRQGREGQPSPSGREGSQQAGQQRGEQGGQQQGEQAGAQGRQSGEGGQDPQGGSPGRGDVRGLTANAVGPPTGIGPYRDEDIRQLRREMQERLTDATDLRRLMNQNPTQLENLDQVIQQLRRLNAGRDLDDPEEVARLRGAIELLRQVELDLSRDLARMTQRDKYFYAEDSEAPSRYKKLVEEYYKALARRKPR